MAARCRLQWKIECEVLRMGNANVEGVVPSDEAIVLGDFGGEGAKRAWRDWFVPCRGESRCSLEVRRASLEGRGPGLDKRWSSMLPEALD